MKNSVINILLLALIFLNHKSYSSHIIGGEIYYECLGYGNHGLDTSKRKYLITVKLYRDCFGSTVKFDSVLGFTIYRQSGSNFINTKIGTGINSEYRIPFTIPVQRIAPPVYKCLETPKHVCVEEGIYQVEVELPIIDESYVIVWQRCCRNYSLSNIEDPGRAGATFSMEIHSEAQKTCNSSPRFKNFPPTVLCVNEPFTFDHSAIDKEGDLLVYEFCTPLRGGDASFSKIECKGGDPSPDCPPPYQPVVFKSPYSASSPIGGSPPIAINSLDGVIIGKPTIVGQFVVSVCVYEYRKGVLLSVLKRDFQFNVAVCEGYVIAKIDGKEATPKHFELNLCGGSIWKGYNRSFDKNYIREIMWITGKDKLTDTLYGWEPTIKFKEVGYYNGKFILNPYSNCSDTGYFKIHVIPDLKVDFTMDYRPCNSGPLQLFDNSSSGYSKIIKWEWTSSPWVHNKVISSERNPTVQFEYPGHHTVYLNVRDNFGCNLSIGKTVAWYPAPDVLLFRPNVYEGCKPLKVTLQNVSFPTDYSYRFYWQFSDGVIDSGYSVKHIFNDKGNYDVRLKVVGRYGCENEAEFKDVFKVYDPPTAAWSIDTNFVNIIDPVFYAKDESEGTIGRTWIVDSSYYFFDPSLEIELTDTGYHYIRMIAADRFLCTDTLDADLYFSKASQLYMPNAFTPNGDGSNDFFGPVGRFHSLEKYELNIFDRWGQKVFSSQDPNQSWNGNYFNKGVDLQPGNFIYELVYKMKHKEIHHERKMLTLIR